MRKISTIITVLLIATVLAGCAQKADGTSINKQSTNGDADDKLSIVTTIFPAYDFARAITGDNADISVLIKPGAEIHSFEPTPADIIKIENADLFIYIGGESEEWVEKLLRTEEAKGVKILRLMDYVDHVEEELVEGMMSADEAGEAGGDEEEAEIDEHIWTSPKNAILLVEAIGNAVCEIDSNNSATYQDNEKEYIAEIEAIDKDFKKVADEGKRSMIVFGDRYPFRYLSDAYGLSYRAAFTGCSNDTEIDAATMAYLINQVEDGDLPYVYYIELSNQKIAQAISEQTGAEMLLLHSCQNVTKDEFEAGETYVSIMRQNVENLEKGLN